MACGRVHVELKSGAVCEDFTLTVRNLSIVRHHLAWTGGSVEN